MARNSTPTLFVFSGLPASGKSTLAQLLAGHAGAAYLRIDTLEQALRDLAALSVTADEGYRLAYRMASDNLRAGVGVVADSCNPIALTREAWMDVARSEGCPCVNIEVTCSDPMEHRRRVEDRVSQVPGLRLPTWEEVRNRTCEPWTSPRVAVDTAGRSIGESFLELLEGVGAEGQGTLLSFPP